MGQRIAIGTDHGGFEAKNTLAGFLESQGHEVLDMGTYTPESTDYPIYASRVARAVASGSADAGVILCRSGNGVAMVANRFPGVRAGLASTPDTARLARSHNDANVLVLGCDHASHPLEDLVTQWLGAEYEGGRHARRVGQIGDIDRLNASTRVVHKLLLAGQSTWLSGLPGDDLARRVESLEVRGVLLDRAGAGDAWQALVAQATAALEPVRLASGGEDGWVAVTAGAYSLKTLAATAREIPGLLPIIEIAGDGRGVVELAAEASVSLGFAPESTPEAVEEVAVAWGAALGKRVAAGQPVHDRRSVILVHGGNPRALREAIRRASRDAVWVPVVRHGGQPPRLLIPVTEAETARATLPGAPEIILAMPDAVIDTL